jgi:hypothetical protein
LEGKKSSVDRLDIPSTSKSLSSIKEVYFSNNNPDVDQQCSTSSLYFEPKTEYKNNIEDSPEYHLSDHSNGSFSENSLEFSSEESLSEDNIGLG